MKYGKLLAALLILGLATAAQAGPKKGEPRPGRIAPVLCLTDAEQSYTVYLPKGYEDSRPWPILYCFSPSADGGAFVEMFRPAAERNGWIVVASNTAKNGPEEPTERATRAMLRDTEARFALHAKKRFAAGFSGGSWMASRMAYRRTDRFAGVIVIGQGLFPELKLDPGLAVAMLAGESDRMKGELELLVRSCESCRVKVHHRLMIYPGGHVLPPPEHAGKAIDWHEATWRERFEGDSDAAKRARRAAVAKRIRSAEARAGEGKPAHALAEYRAIRVGFAGWRIDADLDARITKLEKAPEVEAEIAARKALLKLVRKDRALRPRQRAGLGPAYRRIAEKYAGTPSAELAADRALRLDRKKS